MKSTNRQQAQSDLGMAAKAIGQSESVRIELTGRELAFLRDVIAHFRATHCAEEGLAEACELMTWYEAPQGHLERACQNMCDQLIARLVPDREADA